MNCPGSTRFANSSARAISPGVPDAKHGDRGRGGWTDGAYEIYKIFFLNWSDIIKLIKLRIILGDWTCHISSISSSRCSCIFMQSITYDIIVWVLTWSNCWFYCEHHIDSLYQYWTMNICCKLFKTKYNILAK